MDVSPDEIFVTCASSAIAVFTWAKWYHAALFTARRLSTLSERNTIITAPLVAMGLLLSFLLLYADELVRTDVFYLTQYMFMGAALVGILMQASPLLGISARDDVIERRNHAAGVVLSGAILGLMFCYAGSNIGDGPGWWVVVFCTGLAVIAFVATWLLMEVVGHVSEAVTVERHMPTAIRFHSFLSAMGLILGRAVAGDWVDFADTLSDFAVIASPAVIFIGVELTRLRMRETKSHRRGYRNDSSGASSGMGDYFLAIGYYAIAVMYLIGLGWWM